MTREEPGCITFDVTQDITDTYRYNVHETFVDRAAFEYHQQRVARSEWGRLTCHAQRHYEIVE
ncbi:antibiotic biosynthesis monooxygenase [Halomonas sp. S3-1-1]|uniref:putative quinol monooxygenase n=1 Tax=Halomonas sp. S3-1-1 TaxID=2912763 RepID=UPI00256F5CF9|nr:antibiotic biosynthesis monooxygenase [Halomonas sp. S3-1-1]